jgi:membrane fusion protein, copper/silver efflux system
MKPAIRSLFVFSLLSLAAGGPAVLSACTKKDDHQHDDGIAYYVCPMHPSVKQDRFGQCPICHMDLVPVSKESQEDKAVTVDGHRKSIVGIETAAVRRGSIESTVRAVGRVAFDETRLRDVSLRVAGWIEDVRVDQQGLVVKAGEPLFTLSSPELFAAQAEAVRARAAGDEGLVAAARRRLELWGMTAGQIEALLDGGTATDRVPILAPQSGVVIEKDLVAGARAEPGMRLLRIARLDRVWVEADVFATDVGGLAPGLPARVRIHSTGQLLEGTIARVLPAVDAAARTARVRIDVKNADGVLLPGMATEVEIGRGAGSEALLVPSSAVVYTGPRRVVFVETVTDAGASRFEPRTIEVGRRGEGPEGTGEVVEVRAGLVEGEVVVVAGGFLVAAEARLKGWEAP